MAELVEFLDARKPEGLSTEEYARQMGISGALLYYYKKGQRKTTGIRIDTVQGIAGYFAERGDKEALSELAKMVLGVEGEFIPST